jgi:hypothetical protein
MEDSWADCPYCVKTGYQQVGSGGLDKTRLESAMPTGSCGQAAAPAFDPSKTVPLSIIRRAPVVGWLVALNGAHKGEDFRLREGKNSLGSAPGSDVALRDPAISAHHASLSYKDGEFFITDLDSTNGTFLNDGLAPVARVKLQDNDLVKLGETSLKFKCL